MRLAPVVSMIATVAVILLFTLLPFLPGDHDALAVPLSVTSRLLGFASLLFVPIAILGLAGKQRLFGTAGWITTTIAGAIVSLIAFAAGGIVFGVAILIVSAVAVRTFRSRRDTASPLFFIAVPIAIVLLQWMLVPRAVEFSRARAIRNSAPLIADLEKYRRKQGHYPPSLLAVNPDYKPAIIGVPHYHYERSGDAYNVVFEQPALPFGTQEFVVYNPLDQQVMTSHAMALVQNPAELRWRRGHYAVRDAGHPHWKSFLFD